MNTRDTILAKLRRQIVDQIPLPTMEQDSWIEFEDPIAKLTETIEFVGGTCVQLESVQELPARLAEFPEWEAANRVFSTVDPVSGSVQLDEVEDPHELENLDFVVYPGEFAVAENGAIWVTDRELRHRVVFFITQFLVLVVKKDAILNNMHEAYRRAQMPQPGFGLFLSGPSKTADIEQSLVIGAHGCRELQVYLV